jgi:hypothetical protein
MRVKGLNVQHPMLISNLSAFSRNACEASWTPFFHVFKISLCTLRNLQVEGY